MISKQYSVSLSGQVHYFKVKYTYLTKELSSFSSVYVKATQRCKYMVLTFLMVFLSFSLRTSHGLHWLWQCHCRRGRSRMPEELSDSRYGMCKYRHFIFSWKHIKLDTFYNYQLQLDSSIRGMLQVIFSIWSLQYRTHCVSGCVCPHNQVLDGKGSCIAPEDCPCIHNGNSYSPGESIRVGCNNW